MGIRINCMWNDRGAWCKNEKIGRSLFGIGARCCVEYPYVQKGCPEKRCPKPGAMPPPPPPKRSSARPANCRLFPERLIDPPKKKEPSPNEIVHVNVESGTHLHHSSRPANRLMFTLSNGRKFTVDALEIIEKESQDEEIMTLPLGRCATTGRLGIVVGEEK